MALKLIFHPQFLSPKFHTILSSHTLDTVLAPKTPLKRNMSWAHFVVWIHHFFFCNPCSTVTCFYSLPSKVDFFPSLIYYPALTTFSYGRAQRAKWRLGIFFLQDILSPCSSQPMTSPTCLSCLLFLLSELLLPPSNPSSSLWSLSFPLCLWSSGPCCLWTAICIWLISSISHVQWQGKLIKSIDRWMTAWVFGREPPLSSFLFSFCFHSVPSHVPS